MIQSPMRLWTDDRYSEFAIFYQSSMVIKTSENAKYTQMLDESPYRHGYDTNWGHTLSEWVIFYLSNKYANIIRGTEKPTKAQFQLESTNTDTESYIDFVSSSDTLDTKPRNKQSKPTLRCHFCKLKYCIEEERIEHEKFWHSK
jgi:hypothetical protein